MSTSATAFVKAAAAGLMPLVDIANADLVDVAARNEGSFTLEQFGSLGCMNAVGLPSHVGHSLIALATDPTAMMSASRLAPVTLPTCMVSGTARADNIWMPPHAAARIMCASNVGGA